MTLIVNPRHFKSKAHLKESLETGILIEDPSMFGSNQSGTSEDKPIGWSGVVTNHPLRTKFAKIEKRADGWKVS